MPFVCRRSDGSGLAKLLDFGIAKLCSSDPTAANFTRTGTAMGTPYDMPPEQARGAKSIDHRADVWALGVILHELLSGQKPHPGESYNEILTSILMNEPMALGRIRPDPVNRLRR